MKPECRRPEVTVQKSAARLCNKPRGFISNYMHIGLAREVFSRMICWSLICMASSKYSIYNEARTYISFLAIYGIGLVLIVNLMPSRKRP